MFKKISNNLVLAVIAVLIVISLTAGIGGAMGYFGFGSGSSASTPISAGGVSDKGLIGYWPLDTIAEKVGSDLVSNGTFETDVTTGWTVHGSSTNTKESGTRTGGSGSYVLRNTTTATNSGSKKAGTALVVGKTYRVTGWTRSDGTGEPEVWLGGAASPYWQGTTSTSWQNFDFTAVANDASFYLTNDSASASYVEWDDVIVKEIQTADKTPNENHGTVYGATVGADATSFNGTDNYISIPDSPEFDLTGAFTISAWVKTSQSAQEAIVCKDGDSSDYPNYCIDFLSGTIRLFGYEGSSGKGLAVASKDISDNEWHHIVGTFDGVDNWNIYVDVTATGSATEAASLTTTNKPLLIGDRAMRASMEYNGSIDEVRFYNRALSTDEITALYNNGTRNSTRAMTISSQSKGLIFHAPLDSKSEKVGSELVINGTFDSSDDWSVGSGWSIGGGIATASSTGGTLSQVITLTEGVTYRISFDMTRTSGILYVDLGSDTIPQTFTDANAHKEIEIVASSSNIVRFYGGGISGTVDNVSVKEIQTVDTTPNSNHGTVYGATNTTDRKGQSNMAMSFDGTDDYIDTNYTAALSSADFSVSAWIKQGAGQSYAVSQAHTAPSYSSDWFFPFGGGNSIFWMRAVGLGSASSLIEDNQWHHLVMVWDVSEEKYTGYVDGASLGQSAAVTSYGGINSVKIGVRGDGTTSFYNGSIDDVRIYDRVITQDEVTSLYDSYNNNVTSGSLTKGLVGQWDLTEKSEKVGSEEHSNSDIEDGATTNWSWDPKTNGVRTNETSDVYAGSTSARLTNSTENPIAFWEPQSGVTVGQYYRVTVYAKDVDCPTIPYFSAAGATWVSGDTSFTGISTSAWTRYSAVYRATGTSVAIYVRTAANAAQGDFLIDNFSLKKILTKDSTPYENHGTVYGATQNTDYMSFDGTDDYVVTSDDSTGGNIVSVSTWIKTSYNNVAIDNGIIGKWDTGEGKRIYMFSHDVTTNYLSFLTSPDGAYSASNRVYYTTAINDGEWHHIVGVHDGSSNYLYVDGDLKDSADVDNGLYGTTQSISYGVILNSNTPLANSFFNGDISNIRFYNRVLSSAEILSLYNKGQ